MIDSDHVRTSWDAEAQIAVERFDGTPFDAIVAVAPRRSPNFAERLDAYEALRSLGIAE